uniref:Reverse transcriptase domain-containing protein n=1 Tax=Arion vulgaris TaxID=1028688 RepID=A0A0B7BPD3_9EUPU
MNITNEDILLSNGTVVGDLCEVDSTGDMDYNVVSATSVECAVSGGEKFGFVGSANIHIGSRRFDLDQMHGSADQKAALLSLLCEYDDVFSYNDSDVGYADKVQHQIRLQDTNPIKLPYRRIPPAFYTEVQNHIADLLQKQVIRESVSPWAAPVVLLKKKNGSLRLCVDYCELNKKTIKDAYPLLRIDDYLDSLNGAKLFSPLDLTSGYYQVAMKPEDIDKTAFCTPFGLYEYTRMPMGLTNSAGTFQRLMQNSMNDFMFKSLLVYLDDMLIFSGNFDDHLVRLGNVLERIRAIGLKVNPDKCVFCRNKVDFLGHTISDVGIETQRSKISSIQQLSLPTSIKHVRAFLGMASYYRKFIPNFSNIAKPLLDIVNGGDQADKSRNIKQRKSKGIFYME